MDMIERVARAIHAKHNAADDNEHWFYVDPSKCRHSQQLARAAIEAMREPTPAINGIETGSISYSADQLWRSMIDAALKPEVQQ